MKIPQKQLLTVRHKDGMGTVGRLINSNNKLYFTIGWSDFWREKFDSSHVVLDCYFHFDLLLCRFYGIELVKMETIDSNVCIFENRKK